MKNTRRRGLFIYITGCDGTGKSTQARLLVDYLRKNKVKVKHLWLRFPFLLSTPLLVYARWRGFSYREQKNGRQYGYWDFWRSRLLKLLFPWLLLLDAALAACRHIYISLLSGTTIVCERFVLDMQVDLMIAYRDYLFPEKWPGKLYTKLLPPSSCLILLTADPKTIIKRRPELKGDRTLKDRLKAFDRLAKIQRCPVIVSKQSIQTTHAAIVALLKGRL